MNYWWKEFWKAFFGNWWIFPLPTILFHVLGIGEVTPTGWYVIGGITYMSGLLHYWLANAKR